MNTQRRSYLKQKLLTLAGWAAIPALAEETEKVELEFLDICNSLVIIEFSHAGGEGKALGVIATMQEKPYILTNQHILLGTTKMSFITAGGEKLAPRSVELSTSRDIARLALTESQNALPITQSKSKMNTPIVLVNAGNEKDDRIQQGSIIGIGGIKFEISAAIKEETNGAPVLNRDREIIGIASYSRKSGYHAMKKGTRFDDAERHFCYRVDDRGWKKVNWKTYNRTFGKPFRSHKALGDQILNILKDRDNRISRKDAQEIATACRTHARQIELLADQKGITDYLATELEEHTELFNFAEEFFTDYANGQ
jgi:hypothetical protein